jgi:predicted phage gp36 major capsid-like protein
MDQVSKLREENKKLRAQLKESKSVAGTKKDAGPKESMKDKMARLRSMQKKNKPAAKKKA